MKKKGLLVTLGLFLTAAIISDKKKQKKALKDHAQSDNIQEN